MQEFPHEWRESWNHTPDPYEKLEGLWPLRAGHNRAKPDYHIGPRFIECFSFHFVTAGQVLFETDGANFTLSRGDLFCIFPFQVVSYRTTATEPALQMCWLAFHGPLAQTLVRMVGLTPQAPCRHSIFTEEEAQILQQLISLFNQHTERASVRRLGLMHLLFSSLMPASSSVPEHKPQHSWLARSLELLNTHYTESINVAEIADLVGIQRSHFSTSFTAQVGITPQAYLHTLRMKKAVQLLTETDFSITEIALSLGYTNSSTFSRAFQRSLGVSPSSYRRSH
uniref:AraC family transcriptional regulator n=1 Tax=Thermosporothrix sp. COM3 TaxID=2490863 RepID=A0A455SA49_9CHLR|nr:AraC family transcriptional regulator [Thermosporothrix sp. COM3]